VFDPLDGSSIVGANLAVGSIFGIYKGKGPGKSGRDQVAAIYAVYGPRTLFVMARPSPSAAAAAAAGTQVVSCFCVRLCTKTRVYTACHQLNGPRKRLLLTPILPFSSNRYASILFGNARPPKNAVQCVHWHNGVLQCMCLAVYKHS